MKLKRLGISVCVLVLLVAALLVPPPVVQARDCSHDVFQACYDLGWSHYFQCMSFGNSEQSCGSLRDTTWANCFRIHNCNVD